MALIVELNPTNPQQPNLQFYDSNTGTLLTQSNPVSGDLSGYTPNQLSNIVNAVNSGILILVSGVLPLAAALPVVLAQGIGPGSSISNPVYVAGITSGSPGGSGGTGGTTSGLGTYVANLPTLTDQQTTPILVDASGEQLVTDVTTHGALTTVISQLGVAAQDSSIQTLVTKLGNVAQEGTDAAGISQDTGGAGIRGWLSSNVKNLRLAIPLLSNILSQLQGTISVLPLSNVPLANPSFVPAQNGGNPVSPSNLVLLSLPANTRSVQFHLGSDPTNPDSVQLLLWNTSLGSPSGINVTTTPQVIPPLVGQMAAGAGGVAPTIAVDTTNGYQLYVIGVVATSTSGGPRYIPFS